MAQPAHTGTMEQVLRFLKAMAISPAYTAEIQALIANAQQTLTYVIKDVNGVNYNVQMADTQYADMSWVPTAFQPDNVVITDAMKIAPPFPRLVFIGQKSTLRNRTDDGSVREQILMIDCVFVTTSDNAQTAERKALIMADAFERLLSRNQVLGGLVQVIEATDAPSPAASTGGSGTIGGALLQIRALVLRY